MNIIIKNLTLATFILFTHALLMCSQAQKSSCLATITSIERRSISYQEVKRQQALKEVLADCLTDMPMDLIKIITSYAPYVLQGKHTKSLNGHSNEIIDLLPLPDGTVVACSADHTITIWNTPAGRCEQTLSEHQAPVYLLTAMPDGRFMSFDTKGISCTWKKNGTNKWDLEYKLKTNPGIRSCLAFQNNEVIMGLCNGTIEWWKEDQFKQQLTYLNTQTMHRYQVTSLAPLSDRRFASQSSDQLIVWELQQSKAWWTNPRNAKASPWICSIVRENELYPEYPGHAQHFSLAILPDNILVEGTPQGIHVWYNLKNNWKSSQLLEISDVSALATLQDGRFAARIGNKIKTFAYSAQEKQWKLDQTVELKNQKSSKPTSQIPSSTTLAVLTSGELTAGTAAPTERVSDPYQGRIEVIA